jgi:hypothetical protein
VFLLRWVSREYGSVSRDNFLDAIHLILNRDNQDGNRPAYIKSYAKYMVPSLLYLVNNLLYLVALKLTTPALLHVAILAKASQKQNSFGLSERTDFV